MKAAFIHQPGPPENIVVDELPRPEVAGSRVLVKVGAVSVNPIDTYIRGGADYWELPQPFIIGCDLAGAVEAVGPDVTELAVGDRVWGTNQGVLGRQGTFAEYCAVDGRWLYPTPDEVSDEAAAACSLVGITAHLGLFRDADLQPGEVLFVNGGTGGVGSMVVQMARAAGARVIATAGSDEKVAVCRELGAELAVNYKTHDVASEIARFAPEGINVYWETLREPNLDAIVDTMADRGRIVVMAGRDARPEFPIGPFYVKNLAMFGFVMFKATAAEQRACAAGINRWLSTGRIKARVDRVMPLDQAVAAHRLQEDNTLGKKGTLAGKIVLKPVPA